MAQTIVNTTLTSNVTLIEINTGNTAQLKVFLLPQASLNPGKFYFFKDLTGAASTNNVFISTSANGDSIDRTGRQAFLNTSYGSIGLMSDGSTTWKTIASYLGEYSQFLT